MLGPPVCSLHARCHRQEARAQPEARLMWLRQLAQTKRTKPRRRTPRVVSHSATEAQRREEEERAFVIKVFVFGSNHYAS